MPQAASSSESGAFLDFYDAALPHVYGYISARCGGSALAEDLTAETFMAAVDATQRLDAPALTMPWIIGVARHKLIDHWRRQERDERRVRALAEEEPPPRDRFEDSLDAVRVRETLQRLTAAHCAALTLRYFDDLAVPEVAYFLGRSVHATEALLVRARIAFRRAYLEEGPHV